MEMERKLATVTGMDKDPAKAGRIQVQFEDTEGQTYPEWVDAVFPAGWFIPPEVGDVVVLEIPAGGEIMEFPREVHYVGKLGSKDQAADGLFKTNYGKRRGFKSKGGNFFYLDDKDKAVVIQTNGGHSVTLDDTNRKLVLETNGGHVITLSDIGGSVTITNGTSSNDISMSSTGTTTVDGTVAVHLNALITDLSDVSTDFLIKGTLFNVGFLAWVALMATAEAALLALVTKWDSLATGSPGSPWIPSADAAEITALKNAMALLTPAGYQALVTAAPLWMSLKVRTG